MALPDDSAAVRAAPFFEPMASRSLTGWLLLALAALVLLPWHQQPDGALQWLVGLPASAAAAEGAPTWWLALRWQRSALWPLIAAPLLAALVVALPLPGWPRQRRGAVLCLVGGGALLWLALMGWGAGWGMGLGGASSPALASTPVDAGYGWGTLVYALAMLCVASTGAAWLGACKGDVFICGVIALLVALVGLFVLFPVLQVLAGAFKDDDGLWGINALVDRLAEPRVWSLACIGGGKRCGVAWNTLFLGTLTAGGATLLGLAFALVLTRTGFRFKPALRALTVLPIITPPFVIGLALILLFGRSGTVAGWYADITGSAPGRGLYGFTGVWLAQLLSFTPIAFLVLIGVVEGVSPSVEEASQTLGGSRWTTFARVSLPLMRPGLANAFLVVFIESMADFGNPMVLGGNYGVLSTEIYFAVVGAQNDGGRAAALGMVLLVFAVGAFLAQRRWLGRKSYATVTGKADNGVHAGLDPRMARALILGVSLWTAFTLLLYGMILSGGFVSQWGLDNSFTLRHYIGAFGISTDGGALRWVGTAWNSLFTSLAIAGIAAPLTAALGMLAAWLLVRQHFAGKAALEFATLLSFAIPGTVIGISYILAFNQPPIELTGTAAILVLCFVFRNMPTGLRGGIAAMSQLDRSLDEASTTLGASSFTTARRVVLPLLRPALATALVYSFVRSITSISAVIFLVSAEHNMATAYIVGLVENGQYGIAIAYASVLIVVMLTCILSVQALVGRRRLRRADRVQGQPGATATPIALNKA